MMQVTRWADQPSLNLCRTDDLAHSHNADLIFARQRRLGFSCCAALADDIIARRQGVQPTQRSLHRRCHI